MIVIDTNILISALIKESTTRKIIIESGFEFAYPEISLIEILKYKSYIIKKAGYSNLDFEKIFNKLLDYLNLVPLKIIESNLLEANKLIGKVDPDDIIFVATALTLKNSIIWSEDNDFLKQSIIKTVKTKELLNLIQR